MMGRGQLRSTHVMPETLEPEWNEMIEMLVYYYPATKYYGTMQSFILM